MKIPQAQLEQIEHNLPTGCGNISLNVLNAILHAVKRRCKWRGVPQRFGNWHTVSLRVSRWSKRNRLDRALIELQHA